MQAAITEALAQKDRPTLICCRTIIGFGAPNKQGTEATHGAALGAEEVAAARKELNWPYEPFAIPDDIRKDWDARERGAALEAKWRERFAAYRAQFPELAAEYERRMKGELPAAWRDIVKLPDVFAKDDSTGAPGVNFYASTGHTHRFGTHAQLGMADSDTDDGTTIYNPVPYSWTDAPLEQYDPPLQISKGGGFRFNCAWENPTNEVITYGESALQEMCFFWAYYYPRVTAPGTPRTLIILPRQ